MRLKWLILGATLGLIAIGVGAVFALPRGGEPKAEPPPRPIPAALAREDESLSRKIDLPHEEEIEPEPPPEDEWPEGKQEAPPPREEETAPPPAAVETEKKKEPEPRPAEKALGIKLSAEPSAIRPGGEVRARVGLEGAVPEGAQVIVECRDGAGGLIFRSQAAPAGKRELEFAIEVSRAYAVRHRVRASCAGKEAEAEFTVELPPPTKELVSFREHEGLLLDARGRAIEKLARGAQPRRPEGTFACLVRAPAAVRDAHGGAEEEEGPGEAALRVRTMKLRTQGLLSKVSRLRATGLLAGAEAGSDLDFSAVARETAFLATGQLILARAFRKPVLCEAASAADAWRAFLYGARWFKGEHPEFPAGLAGLLARAAFATDRIAVYYSPASLAAEGGEAFDAAFRLVQEAGFQARAVTAEGLLSGKVRETGFEFLYLPRVSCLSAEEARGIRDFARSGKIVVADVPPGARDAEGVEMPLVRMDSFFGVLRMRRRPATPVGVRFVRGAFAGKKLKVAPADSTMAPLPVEDGYPEVRGRAKSDVPVFIVMRHGRGYSVLLNLRMHEAEPGSAEELDASRVMRACIDLTGVAPQFRLSSADGTPARGVETVSWQNGGQGVVAFLARSGKRDLKAVLGREYAVYDALRGKHLGNRAELRFSSSPEGPAVFVFDSELTPLSLEASAVCAGGELKVEVAFEGGDPGVRGVHLELVRPDGSRAGRYSRVVFTEFDSVEATVSLTLDDPEGEWTARLRDAATGTATEARFRVERRTP